MGLKLEPRNTSCVSQPLAACKRLHKNKLLFSTMSSSSSLFQPNPISSLLSNCTSISHLKQLHSQMIRTGLLHSPAHQSHLLSFCCSHPNPTFLHYARQLFDQTPHPNSLLFNTIIRAYSNHNLPLPALSLYLQMLSFPSSSPNQYTFPFLLKSFDRGTAILFGDEIHAHVLKFGLWDNPYVQNALLHMYSISGESDTARELFERSSSRDAAMWNAMISGYNRSKLFREACELFREMRAENVCASLVTFILVLSACAKTKNLDFGIWVHRIIDECSVIPTLKLQNALLGMYAACGGMDVAWSIFKGMQERDVVSWTSVVTGFANAGQLDRAKDLFDQMPESDVVSWTAMIDGYVQAGQYREALEMFRKLQGTTITPDKFTMVSVLTACAQLGAFEIGEWIRVYLEHNRIKIDVHVGNALIDMYCKCGCVESAGGVFNKMPHRDKFTWTALIVGLAINGHGEAALGLFYEMLRTSVKPDDVTFIGVLSACSHSGLVDEGREHFSSMITTHGIMPSVAHYGCLVDLLGRAGQLQDALETITNMPMKPNLRVWGSLLAACRVYKNVEMAELAAYHLLQLDPDNGACYILLSNIYAKCERWDEVRRIRKMMMERGMKKEAGCSSIEMRGEVYEFVSGDRSHPLSRDIYFKLEEMGEELRFAGYAPDTSEVLLEMREEEKESSVFQHSEKLAVAFGLLNSSPGATLRVVKNLRVCVDCHSAMKLISRLYRREIIVRDRTRFHHFSDGSCSCKDFW